MDVPALQNFFAVLSSSMVGRRAKSRSQITSKSAENDRPDGVLGQGLEPAFPGSGPANTAPWMSAGPENGTPQGLTSHHRNVEIAY
jgi:hypothetical protein